MSTATLTPAPWLSRSPDLHLQAIARAARPDYLDWLDHVRPAAGCARPVRLHGDILTVEADTGRLLSTAPSRSRRAGTSGAKSSPNSSGSSAARILIMPRCRQA